MIPVADNTIIIGTAELRKEIPQLTKDLKTKTVIVTKKGKPIAVLEDFGEYQEKNRLFETFEDIVLGYLAKERDSKGKRSDFISEKNVAKRLGIDL
ncbi:MAG: hypothetical protein UY05_C0006G0017 [Candidatus Peregrinibacteria bacterium GW2011_GWA2_47_7]|nr:MAG: hypothetical protein UY05_C0006G0017 [Candidatus Peregrinibacteria bacterium GW2011_GWA2_47_7]